MMIGMAKKPPTLANYLRGLPICVVAGLLGPLIFGLTVGEVGVAVVFGLFLGFGMWLTGIAISRWTWRGHPKA
jgi:hypothetical protein